jgi:uncharacterized protein (DUF2336 family)
VTRIGIVSPHEIRARQRELLFGNRRGTASILTSRPLSVADYRAVEAEVLLLGGSRSPAHLKRALTALEGVLPRARRVELRGVGHEATSNTAMRGRPDRVADVVSRFLA